MDAIENIIKAGKETKLIYIYYQKKNGDQKYYTLEPYSFRGSKFFGWDVEEDKIKCYILDNIMSVVILNTTYIARFPVEF